MPVEIIREYYKDGLFSDAHLANFAEIGWITENERSSIITDSEGVNDMG